jgi:hypothetical protein
LGNGRRLGRHSFARRPTDTPRPKPCIVPCCNEEEKVIE